MSVAIWKPEEETQILIPYAQHEGEEVRADWAPQAGSQEAFLACPIFEVLYEGTRGPGKTDALLMDFAQHVGKGYGTEWRGVLFRESYPELQDVIQKSKRWFKQIWPLASYNESAHVWTWPKGEKLYFRFMNKSDDYWKYHGHAYPWIGWEELTNWADPSCYTVMMSCSRSTVPNMPRKYRATCNPYGIGHNWVKKRWRLPLPRGRVCGSVILDSHGRDGNLEPPRVAVHGELRENKILLHADPFYIQKIRAAARNKNEAKAWEFGSWDIVAGGICDDVWDPTYNVLPNFPFHLIPKQWSITRSYDHGQSKPFSCGWWAESNGEPFQYEGQWIGAVPGYLIRISEWYGFTGEDNEGLRMLASDIAQGITDREDDWGIRVRVKRGVADSSIFDEVEPLKSVAGDMLKKNVSWEHADKKPGSRKQGWQRMREYMWHAHPDSNGFREEPGLFVCERCANFRRTVPVLPRSDKDLDDVNTNAEDHIGDETRYRLRWKQVITRQGSF